VAHGLIIRALSSPQTGEKRVLIVG
jgi:hypothetical protein